MPKKQSFEDSLLRLQEIVMQLEKGETSLQDSLAFFEEGAKLSAQCYKILHDAEQKITEMSDGLVKECE